MAIATVLVGASFAAGGAALLSVTLLGPFLGYEQARGWVRTPCVVESSQVVESGNGEGDPLYQELVRYRYRFGPGTWRAQRYDTTPRTSSERWEKEAIVARYPPGAESFCLVDPARPAQAVLVRTLRVNRWWPGGFALLALGVHLCLSALGWVWPLAALTAWVWRLVVREPEPAPARAPAGGAEAGAEPDWIVPPTAR